MAEPNITEAVATALRARNKEFADNVLNHNALLQRLNQKGNVNPLTGGREIVEELEYAENSTVAWYSGYETLDITPQTVFDAATFDWKQLAGTVSISGLEEIKNAGENRIVPLLAKRIKNLEKSMMNTAATAVFADGTGSAGKEIGGLQLLVADLPTTGTVGGINRATYTWWRNQYSAAAATTSANIQSRMNDMYLDTLRGADHVDFIVANKVMFTHYEESLQQYQRFTNGDMANTGFNTLKYKMADVIYDDQCPANNMYFLNTDYIYLRPFQGRQFVPLDSRDSLNQDASVVPVVWAGNMTCSNSSLQGVIIAS